MAHFTPDSWLNCTQIIHAREKNTKASKELREERKEKEKLEKELARKEKALAEAAALLVLRKKADAIWGTEQEDE